MKNLNGHQIDVLRRAILSLINRNGIARLVFLAPYLISLGENGFAKGNWCGYGKLKTLLEAYPEFFEVYNDEFKGLSVKIINTNNNYTTNEGIATVDRNVFFRFVMDNITSDFHQEIINEFDLKDGLEDLCVFSHYLVYTLLKAASEGKVLERNNLIMFHTGWFHNNTDDIYFIWGYDNGRPVKGFFRRSGRDARDFIRLFDNNVPEMVKFPVMQFDTDLHIETEFGHIFDERADRIPTEVIDMVRNSPELTNEYRDCSDTELVMKCRNFLRRLLIGCIQDTRIRLANRRDEAVQFWDRRRDKMCWLIPLRMGITDKVNLALVLEPSTLNDIPVYRAHTILGLKEAFKCARLLGPVKAEWLCEAWKDTNN